MHLIPFRPLTFCMNKQDPTKLENFGHSTWLSSFGGKYSEKELNESELIKHHTRVTNSKRKLSFTTVWQKSYTLPTKP